MRHESEEIVAIAPESGVQDRMLESGGITVAPSMELLCSVEDDGLHGVDSARGSFFALDIEASVDALEEEVHFASSAARGEAAGGACGGGDWIGCERVLRRESARRLRSNEPVHDATPRRSKPAHADRGVRFSATTAATVAAGAL